MNVVAYCRFSSEGQRDGFSIEAQLNAIKKFCAQEGYNLIDTYIDEARSGTNDDRDTFQKMIKDSRHKKFQAVIVHKFDRFARNKYDSVIYKKELRDNGVKVISVLEPLDDSPEAGIMESLYDALAEYYSKNLSRETLKGKIEAAKQARYLGGTLPYGYAIDENKKFVIVETEAVVIREMFSRANSGESFASIARNFYEKGIVNRGGRPFKSTCIARMLTNPMYCGRYSFGIRSRRKEAQPIFVDDAVPAIVTKEAFNTFYDGYMQRVAHKPIIAKNKEEDYFLTGYIFCGECGSHFKGMSYRSKYITTEGEEHIHQRKYYRCSKRKTPPDNYAQRGVLVCQMPLIDKNKIEKFIMALIEDKILSDKTIHELSERLKLRQKSDSTIDKIKKEISKLENSQERLLDLYLDGQIEKEVYAEKKTAITEKIKFYSEKLNKEMMSNVTATPDQIKTALTMFIDSIDKNSPEYKRILIKHCISKITVYKDHLVVDYRIEIPCETYSFSAKNLLSNKTTVST